MARITALVSCMLQKRMLKNDIINFIITVYKIHKDYENSYKPRRKWSWGYPNFYLQSSMDVEKGLSDWLQNWYKRTQIFSIQASILLKNKHCQFVSISGIIGG